MDAGRCAGIFAERPTEWIAVSNPSASNQRFCNYVYMYMSAHECTMRLYTSLAYLSYFNRPSGIYEAAAIAVNRTQGLFDDGSRLKLILAVNYC